MYACRQSPSCAFEILSLRFANLKSLHKKVPLEARSFMLKIKISLEIFLSSLMFLLLCICMHFAWYVHVRENAAEREDS